MPRAVRTQEFLSGLLVGRGSRTRGNAGGVPTDAFDPGPILDTVARLGRERFGISVAVYLADVLPRLTLSDERVICRRLLSDHPTLWPEMEQQCRANWKRLSRYLETGTGPDEQWHRLPADLRALVFVSLFLLEGVAPELPWRTHRYSGLITCGIGREVDDK